MKIIISVLKNCTLLAVLLAITACSSVTIKPKGGAKITGKPTYQVRKDFYLAGLIGEHSVDVNEACNGSNILQMQTLITSNDYLWSMLTLFVYAPRTAKLWCEA